MRRFFIIIPVHNRLEYTIACLNSIHTQTRAGVIVIVVDDGSRDGTGEAIRKDFPDAVLLRGDGNLWFTASVNLGLEYALETAADEDYALIINNDTVIDSNFLVTLEKSVEAHPDALIGAVLLNREDKQTILDGGVYYHRIKNRFHSYNSGRKISEFNRDYRHDAELLPTRGLAIPVRVVKEIGGFDAKNFPQRASDYDFTLRAREKGYRLIVDYSCRVYSESDFGTTPSNTRMSFLQFLRSFGDLRSSYHLKTFLRFGIKHFKEYRLFIPVFLCRLLLGATRMYISSVLKK